MYELKKLLEQSVLCDEIIEIILSNLKVKKPEGYNKIVVKPVALKEKLYYQFSMYYEKKVLHENIEAEFLTEKILNFMENEFKQAVIFTVKEDIQVLTNKKGKVSILKKKATKKKGSVEHNKIKNYILQEGTKIDFLIALGVMNADGKVLAPKYDKFRQINRFLEMIEDIVPNLDTSKELNIIDFGCGKSYLTFALYYYLKKIKGLSINVVGLDLKKDVIDNCNKLAKDLKWEKLNFSVGDIAGYIPQNDIDLMVTLHACDTATDAALEKAVKWNTKVILSVPCCQHELNSKLKNETLNPMLKYGILKERFSALATDAIRANVLEQLGYDVQLLEFIDMEHTPKNILIRAVKDKNGKIKSNEEYKKFKTFLNSDIYLERVLEDLLN